MASSASRLAASTSALRPACRLSPLTSPTPPASRASLAAGSAWWSEAAPGRGCLPWLGGERSEASRVAPLATQPPQRYSCAPRPTVPPPPASAPAHAARSLALLALPPLPPPPAMTPARRAAPESGARPRQPDGSRTASRPRE
eukprot:scaffold39996_cov57-Phaeocystis_antarctica.AAC.1